MVFIRLLFITVSTILLASCVITTPPPANYYEATVQSWQGSSLNALQQHWGVPDSRTVTPQGTILYNYQKSTYRLAPPSQISPMEVAVTSSGKTVLLPYANPEANRNYQKTTCAAIFEVNYKNIITAAHTEGNGCIGGLEFVKKMANPQHPITFHPETSNP